MEARRVRKWPSSFGIDIESNIIGFDIPGSQPGYFFQQQRSHAQNYQMQVDSLLLREPKRLRNLHNHRSTIQFQEGAITTSERSGTSPF